MLESYEIVDTFEKRIAEYAGAKYGVAVDSCCNALFLSLLYCKKYFHAHKNEILLPHKTYPGVACSIIHAGFNLRFLQEGWEGIYRLHPLPIYDSALRFRKNMFIAGSLYCLSFHIKKRLPIGRGGMILTDDKGAYYWLKKARFDGRSQCNLKHDDIDMIGWNMYMTPEQAARGLQLFELIKDKKLKDIDSTKQDYPDLRKIEVYNAK